MILVVFLKFSLKTPFWGVSLKGPYTGYWKTMNPEEKKQREWEQTGKERKKLKNKIKNQIIADSNT